MNVHVPTAALAPTSSEVGGWIQTLTGVQFFPLAPRIADIQIEDIAGSLAKMCRYAGHCTRFYSVAEHCVLMARKAPRHLKLVTLMHDASEAYLVDVPRPLKPFLVGYYEMEDRLMASISERFGLTHPLPAEVKELDNRILADEREQNMATMSASAADWGARHPALGVSLEFWTPPRAANEFLKAFYRYEGKA